MTEITPVDFVRIIYGERFPGFLSLWSRQTRKTRFYSGDEMHLLEADIDELAAGEDLYLALGTQVERLPETERGGANTVVALPGFVADIDFASAKNSKKAYPTDIEEARAILGSFPFKPSIIIETGNGLHVHFLLDELYDVSTPQDREQSIRLWTGFQRKLIAHFRKHGRDIDSIGDLSRNYRIAGTSNHKSNPPKPVHALEIALDQRLSLSAIREFVADVLDPASYGETKSGGQNYALAEHEVIVKGCAWYRNVAVGEAAICDEPNWYAAASITSRCKDGERIFHEYSEKHPKYSQREASQKFKRASEAAGPRTCRSIEFELGHRDCAACPVHGRITSPVQLGHQRGTLYDPGEEGPVPLGFTKEGSYALLDRVRQIIVLSSSSQLLSSQYLVGLAPSSFWDEQFHGRRGFDGQRAGEALIAACKQRGPFNPSRVRGRGVWLEGDRIVINLGVPVQSDRYLYLCFEPIRLVDGANFDGKRLLKLLQMFRWRDPNDAMLLFGWLALAAICGVLQWRPHCFVFGPARSGKTTIHSIAATLLAPLVVAADGQSTEAGIRQSLGPDSLAIILDEFESDQNASKLKQVLRMARSASSADTPVLRGTPEGKAMSFSIRTAFFFAAINPRGMSPADQSRIMMLELLMHDNDSAKARTIAEEEAHFRSLEGAWCSYMVANAHLIEGAINTFEPVIPAADRRLRQNVSSILGAGFVALHGRAPERGEASAMAKEFEGTINRHAEEVERDDALECLEHLFAHVVDDYPLGHWIAAETNHQQSRQNDFADARRIVSMNDIRVKAVDEEEGFFIRNGSPAINRVFEGTVWASGAWQRALRKLAGAFSPKNPLQFSGTGAKARCIGIPLSYLPETLPPPGSKMF